VGIICHPHPLHQGTMHNKVVTTISKAFHQQNLHTVRFNYRGVGQSQGEYGDTVGETEDLMAVIAWVQTVVSQPKIWLAGFSFGSYIAIKGALRIQVEQLYTIAPGVERHNFKDISEISCPWVVIQGEQDEITSAQAVYDWCDSRPEKLSNLSLIKMPEASHFFHGNLTLLRETIVKTMV
jgi:alpha/beta superfamily hydrolase